MTFDKAALLALNEELQDDLEDLTNPTTTTGRPIPEAGTTRLRFVEYIETGMRTTEFSQPGGKKKKTTAPRVRFTFELSGKNHAPMEFDGVQVPHTLSIRSSKGTNSKSGYIKLFKSMVGDVSNATNYIALVGDGFQGKVQHREFDKTDGTKGKAAHLGSATDGFTITPATYEDPETGETKTLKIDEPISPIRVFIWDRPSLAQWDSLYIDGTWDNGDTKNEHQETIKRAENFVGSPIYNLLIESGRADEVEPQQFDSRRAPAPDPLGEAEESAEDKAAAASAAAKAKAKADAAKAAAKAAAEKEDDEVEAAVTKTATKAKTAKPAPEPEEEEEDDDLEAQIRAELAAKRKAKSAAKAKAAAAVDPMADVE